jgi:ribose 5-phosphate isomerase B
MAQAKLFIASDHAGVELKKYILENLDSKTLETWSTQDLGPNSADRVDYPDYAKTLCRELLATCQTETEARQSFGILICGSGQGMAMTANRVPGIRAALAWNSESAKLSREHNDANVICLGARLIDRDLAVSLVQIFLSTPFEGGRHSGRVAKIDL